MKHSALADRYAKAILQLALEEQSHVQVEAELEKLTHACLTDKRIRTFWRSKQIPTDDKQHALQDVLEAMDASALVRNSVNFLFERGRFMALPEIIESYHRQALEMTDVLEATVSSTARLSETELGRIQQRLAESMGKTIQLRTELDPHLIGGIRVRIGNLVLDGSVRGHLNALGRSFSQAFRR